MKLPFLLAVVMVSIDLNRAHQRDYWTRQHSHPHVESSIEYPVRAAYRPVRRPHDLVIILKPLLLFTYLMSPFVTLLAAILGRVLFSGGSVSVVVADPVVPIVVLAENAPVIASVSSETSASNSQVSVAVCLPTCTNETLIVSLTATVVNVLIQTSTSVTTNIVVSPTSFYWTSTTIESSMTTSTSTEKTTLINSFISTISSSLLTTQTSTSTSVSYSDFTITSLASTTVLMTRTVTTTTSVAATARFFVFDSGDWVDWQLDDQTWNVLIEPEIYSLKLPK